MQTGSRTGLKTYTQLFVVGFLAIVLLTLWPGLYGWFVFDDHVNLIASEQWKVTSLNWRDWQRALASDISGAVSRPLAMGSFAVNHYFSGLNPFWLKAGNLALHLLNGLLIWRLSLHIFQLLPKNQHLSAHAAWLVALAWTVHPLHVSTVMYIIQRMEIGAATGILLSLLAYLNGRSRQMAGRIGWPWFLAMILAMSLGLGFKETALLTPGFALLIELTILKFQSRDTVTSCRWKIAWGGIATIGFAAYLYIIIPQVQQWPYGIRDFGPAERLLTQLPVLVMYIQQTLAPLPESMSFYYDNYPISRGLIRPSWTVVSAGILLSLVGLAFTALKRFPLVTLGIGWFFLAHALTSNLWPLELAFEHRNYLASFGLLVALVQPVDELLRRVSAYARIAITVLPVLFLIALCNLQARTWGDPMQLAWTLENRNPDSPRASYDLASQLLIAADDNPTSPFWSMALRQLERSALASSPSPLSLQGLLLMHGRAGIEPPSHYWDALRESLSTKALHGERSGSLRALTACQIQGRCAFDPAQMLATFTTVVQHNPKNPVAHTLYANFAWNVLRDQALAIDLQRSAAALEPSNPVYRVALAKFLLGTQDEDNVAEGRILIRQLHKDNLMGQLDQDLSELERLSRDVAFPSSQVQL